jgi:hypothetical protein
MNLKYEEYLNNEAKCNQLMKEFNVHWKKSAKPFIPKTRDEFIDFVKEIVLAKESGLWKQGNIPFEEICKMMLKDKSK